MTDYTARVCPDCGRTFVAEDDEPACVECAEYAASVKNLPRQEGK